MVCYNKDREITKVLSPEEIHKVCTTFTQFPSTLTKRPTGTTLLEFLDDRILAPLPFLITREDRAGYDNVWDVMTRFVDALVAETSKVLGYQPEYYAKNDWEKIKGGIMNNLDKLGLPNVANKEEATSSTSRVTTISQSRGVDGGFRMKWHENLLPPHINNENPSDDDDNNESKFEKSNDDESDVVDSPGKGKGKGKAKAKAEGKDKGKGKEKA